MSSITTKEATFIFVDELGFGGPVHVILHQGRRVQTAPTHHPNGNLRSVWIVVAVAVLSISVC